MNIDEVKHVIPITESYGLWHPQEGVVNGHFRLKEHEKMKLIGQLRLGVSKIIENPLISPDVSKYYNVADMITGFGVSESVKHFYQIFKNEDIQGKKVIIQGWGNVGSASAFYLTQLGAIVVGIIDKNAGIIDEEGLGYEDIRALFLKKDNNKLVSERKLSFKEINDRIWDISADIFIPAAASKIITRGQIERLIKSGLDVMSCGANVPFLDDDFLFGPTAEIVDEKVSYIPDFIANCGMARAFAYLMQPDVEVTDEAIFNDVSETIKNSLEKIRKVDMINKNLANKGLSIALDELL